MNRAALLTFLLTLLCNLGNLQAQESDSLRLSARVESLAGFSTGGAMPHWLTFNRFGFIDGGDQFDGYFRGEIKYDFIRTKDWYLEAEIDGLVKTDRAFFHELYLNLGWKMFDLQIGKNEINNVAFPDHLSTGSLYISQNAPTIPRITIGILDYTNFPWTKGYVQIRGALSQARLEEDREVSNPWYMEKYIYLRSRKLPVNVYAGFAHNALFGGELNGDELSTNYWEVFFGKQSSTSNVNGDMLNAAGAHFGIIDYGIDIDTKDLGVALYYQQPWSDGSGLQDFSGRNKDYLLGVHIKLNNQKWIQEILYENVNTMNQSGEGLPDPWINGVGYSYADLRGVDYDQFVLDEFGITTNGITFEEMTDIIKRESNNGLEFGGRDSYYTNRAYPNGNTYKGFIIGNALLLTADRLYDMRQIEVFDESFVINNRVQAQHIAVMGNIVPLDIDYKLKVTFSENYGTYAGLYGGFLMSWDRRPNYYFADGIRAHYTSLELQKRFKETPWTLSTAFGYDSRGFGNFFGTLFSLEYRFL